MMENIDQVRLLLDLNETLFPHLGDPPEELIQMTVDTLTSLDLDPEDTDSENVLLHTLLLIRAGTSETHTRLTRICIMLEETVIQNMSLRSQRAVQENLHNAIYQPKYAKMFCS